MAAINDVLNGRRSTTYYQTNIDFVYLQFRFIFESLAMASLCSTRTKYMEVRSSFEKDWNLAKIVKTIEGFHPDFYPLPLVERKSENSSHMKMDFLTDGYLTKQELVESHGRCGGYLHQDNPYKTIKESDYETAKVMFNEWISKLNSLLEYHLVRLFASDEVLIVTMNTQSGDFVKAGLYDPIK